eukprot:3291113-Rhodomonas_salina.1
MMLQLRCLFPDSTSFSFFLPLPPAFCICVPASRSLSLARSLLCSVPGVLFQAGLLGERMELDQRSC